MAGDEGVDGYGALIAMLMTTGQDIYLLGGPRPIL
jgi:hypothetical protein